MVPGRREDAVYPEDEYELTEDGRIPITYQRTTKYHDGNTIDWLHEDNLERQRVHALQSQPGAQGILLPILDSAKMWFIVIMTGVAIGIAGAWLDVLVKWCVPKLISQFTYLRKGMKIRLGDLREGRCSYAFFYNSNACCHALDRKKRLFKPRND